MPSRWNSKTKMSSEIRVASTSDHHLGHRNTPTSHILDNLDIAFPDNEATGQLDLILFGGDLFDRLLTLDDPDVELIKQWINRFLRMCKRRNIIVRFMRGTPSHDWTQNWLVMAEEIDSKIGAKVRYVDTLSIEYIDELGINVLYVPDEWRPETDDTWAEVCQLLQQQGLQQVDFSVIHGCFNYQLPEHVKVPMHIPERYMGITSGYVLGAHIHKPSTYGKNVLVNGSFDRISHGEEEDKGHWRIVLRPGGTNEATFVVNENARTYITVDCTGMPVEDALATIRDHVRTLPVDSNVRIKAGRRDPISNALDQMRTDYPTYKWSSKVVEDSVTQPKLLVDLRSSFQQVTITPDNIEELLVARLIKDGASPDDIAHCRVHLLELL